MMLRITWLCRAAVAPALLALALLPHAASADEVCMTREAAISQPREVRIEAAKCRLDAATDTLRDAARWLRPTLVAFSALENDNFIRNRETARILIHDLDRMFQATDVAATARRLEFELRNIERVGRIYDAEATETIRRNIAVFEPRLKPLREAVSLELTWYRLARGQSTTGASAQVRDAIERFRGGDQGAAAVLRDACDNGFFDACTPLAFAAFNDRDRKGNYSDAVRDGMRACRESLRFDFNACYIAARVHERGLTGAAAQPELARSLYDGICTRGKQPLSCMRQANMAREGLGGATDPAFAYRTFQGYCRRDEANAVGACGRQAELLDAGIGVEADPGAALAMIREHCPKGDQVACGVLGVLQWQGDRVPRDEIAARENTAEGCKARHPRACYVLARMAEAGQGGSINSGLARDAYARACTEGNGIACADEARMMFYGRGGARNEPLARKRFDRLCTDGVGVACHNLGLLHREGLSVPRNAQIARQLFGKGCDAGFQSSCAEIGR